MFSLNRKTYLLKIAIFKNCWQSGWLVFLLGRSTYLLTVAVVGSRSTYLLQKKGHYGLTASPLVVSYGGWSLYTYFVDILY